MLKGAGGTAAPGGGDTRLVQGNTFQRMSAQNVDEIMNKMVKAARRINAKI